MACFFGVVYRSGKTAKRTQTLVGSHTRWGAVADAGIIHRHRGSVTHISWDGRKGEAMPIKKREESKCMYWYVLFVKTGSEQKTAGEIAARWRLESSRPFVPMYEATFRRAGVNRPEKRLLCPGYVFVESELGGADFYGSARPHIRDSENALKLLRYGDGDNAGGRAFEMRREEYMPFMRLCNEDYCIEKSKGFIEGDRVRITEGPLKGHEGRIKKVRASKSEASLEIEMMGNTMCLSVGLEIIRNV